ncbi:MAG: branched-chain amino acid ABC transporter permease [Thermodesulfobacteriota bacterium]|jgi:branched-chain amino acid transport system permease protein
MKFLKPLLVLLVAIILPLIIKQDYYIHLLILVLMWVIIGSCWNLLAGFTGQVSFGQAAFFGVGAYTAGILHTKLEISAWWGMALGGWSAVILGLIIGYLCFRLRGPYFALATLATGEILRLIANNWVDFTEGMVGILIMQTFSSKLFYYYLVLGLASLCLGVIYLTMNSKLGYYFLSIREDQDAAESLGINATLYKNVSLFISAFFTGTVGAFYMNYMGFIDPSVVFALHDISIQAILVGIIGGVGTLWGPAVGALVMVGIQELFRTAFFGLAPKWVSQGHAMAFGILVVLTILFMSNGIVGDWPRIKRIFLKKSSQEAA